MNFTVNKTDFFDCLSAAIKALPKKSSIQALQSVYITVCDNSLTVAGYDLETGIIASTPILNAEQENTEFLADGVLLSNFVQKLPECDISVTVDGSVITLATDKTTFSASVGAVTDYPKMPDDISSEKALCEMEIDGFKALLGRTIYSTAANEIKPVHCGVKFFVQNDEITALAVDGVRMAQAKGKLKNSVDNSSFVVHSKVLQDVIKILAKNEKAVKFGVSGNLCVFKCGDIVVFSRLLQGEFVDVTKILSTSGKAEMELFTTELNESLDRAILISSTGGKINTPVVVDVGADGLDIGCTTATGKMKEKIFAKEETTSKFNAFRIGLNPRYLQEAVKYAGAESIIVSFDSELSPVHINANGGDYKAVVLPVRLKG